MKTMITLGILFAAGVVWGEAAKDVYSVSEDAVVKACKDKRAGVEVIVDGKKVVCPKESKKKASYRS